MRLKVLITISVLRRNLITKKDIENILSALGEAFIAGGCSFVGQNKMQKTIEVVHVFDKDKFTPGIHLPSVRIIIEPIKEDDEKNLININQNLIN